MMEFRFQFEPPQPGPAGLEPFLAALVFQMQAWLAQPGLPEPPPEVAPELAQSFFRALAPALAQWLAQYQEVLPPGLIQQALALAAQLQGRVVVH
jgi:hypothetical protein